MSANNFLSNRMMMGAAVIGIVGAAGMFIYERVYAEKRRAMLVNEVARLDRQVSSMVNELAALRELQKESRNLKRTKVKKRVRREVPKPKLSGDDVVDSQELQERSYASDSEYFTDYQSIVGTDAEQDSEEFYDVHDDEDDDDDDDTLRESLKNGHTNNIFDEDSDRTDSPKKLQKNDT